MQSDPCVSSNAPSLGSSGELGPPCSIFFREGGCMIYLNSLFLHNLSVYSLCITIAVPILLFHLIKTPWCRNLCAYIYIYIYVYIHIDYICIAKYVMVASNICYLFPFNSGSTLDLLESGAWSVDPMRGWWWSDPVDCPGWNVELEFKC